MGTQSKTIALVIVTIAYLTALGAAIGAGWLARGGHPIAMLALADAAGTIIVFGFSFLLRNSSFYDPYWSAAPIAIAGYYAWAYALDGPNPRQWIVLLAVALWGVRLTYNWASGWRGLEHEDWRYVDLQRKHGRAYWLVSFSGIHFFPTLLVFLGCLPLYAVFAGEPAAFNAVDIVATLLIFGAIAVETVADRQLRRFRLTKPAAETILDWGLWKYSRHPNYLGEVGFWWGLFLFGLAVGPEYWWTGAGALSINLLFVFVSIPMMDERHVAKRPAYAEHMQRVPGLVPWPGKRASG